MNYKFGYTCTLCRVVCSRVWTIYHTMKMHWPCGAKEENSSSLLLGIDQTNQVYTNDEQNCKFHYLWSMGSCANYVHTCQ